MAILDWQALTRLTGGAPVQVERVRIEATGIAIEGQFGLPPLAQLPAEDQIFVAAFVRCHGSIKQMEQYFGVSYPTIKNRLNKIGEQLSFVGIEQVPESTTSPSDLIAQIERGEATASDVLKRLKREEKSK